jgi:hypothetical protein
MMIFSLTKLLDHMSCMVSKQGTPVTPEILSLIVLLMAVS